MTQFLEGPTPTPIPPTPAPLIMGAGGSNYNAMHTAKQTFIQSESNDWIICALQYQTRTAGDVWYFTEDILYYKRENSSQ